MRHGVPYPSYLRRSLPPLEFEYSKALIQDQVLELDHAGLENLPAGLDGAVHHWVDLDGEGLPGVLTEQDDALYYRANLGGARLGLVNPLPVQPSLANLADRRQAAGNRPRADSKPGEVDSRPELLGSSTRKDKNDSRDLLLPQAQSRAQTSQGQCRPLRRYRGPRLSSV